MDLRRGARGVRERSAKPRTGVRVPSTPPRAEARFGLRVVNLVDSTAPSLSTSLPPPHQNASGAPSNLYKTCGCRITVIMRPCQGREGGSIPLTRSSAPKARLERGSPAKGGRGSLVLGEAARSNECEARQRRPAQENKTYLS